jgi:hypothetical protein
MIYILSILFTVFFVLYSEWQFSDDREVTSNKWYPYGMVMRDLAIMSPFLCQLFPGSWQDYLLSGAINILVWEILIYIIALDDKLWYVGIASKIDLELQKTKWKVYFAFLIVSLIIKLKY